MTRRHSATQESIISCASKMKEALAGLVEAFSAMIPAIEKEHECIKTGDIRAVEEACADKNVIGERIEAMHTELRIATAQIAKYYGMEIGRPVNFANIQDCLSGLDDLHDQFSQDGVAADVLAHLLTRLRRLTVEFHDAAAKAQPLIEMNKYLIQTLLRNYQESYRFWVDVAAETQATYSAKGVQKASNVGSTLVVRA